MYSQYVVDKWFNKKSVEVCALDSKIIHYVCYWTNVYKDKCVLCFYNKELLLALIFLVINLSIGTSSTCHCPAAFNIEAIRVVKHGTWRYGASYCTSQKWAPEDRYPL
jgi:hypothetical protein